MYKRSTLFFMIVSFFGGICCTLFVSGSPALAASLQDVFTAIDNRLTANANAIAATNAADVGRDSKITQLQADVARLTTDLKSDSDNVDALTVRLNKIDKTGAK